MKLSEAIVMSIGMVENHRGFFLVQKPDRVCMGCAVGTAAYSMGMRSSGFYGSELLLRWWPWTGRIGDLGVAIHREISSRHFDGEPRESIAAWIATIEPPETPTVEEVQEAKGVTT